MFVYEVGESLHGALQTQSLVLMGSRVFDSLVERQGSGKQRESLLMVLVLTGCSCSCLHVWSHLVVVLKLHRCPFCCLFV